MTIAIVIDQVTNFNCCWIYRCVRIITIRVVRYKSYWSCTCILCDIDITKAITIGICIESDQSHSFVNISVTIVVDWVTYFNSRWIYSSIRIITIWIVQYKTRCWVTTINKVQWIAISITICICKENRSYSFINIRITVIIYTVTNFRSHWINSSIRIITITVVKDIAHQIRTSQSIHQCISEWITIGICILKNPIYRIFINRSITVIIYSVANLCLARENLIIKIITIVLTLCETVQILIPEFIYYSITVIIDLITRTRH